MQVCVVFWLYGFVGATVLQYGKMVREHSGSRNRHKSTKNTSENWIRKRYAGFNYNDVKVKPKCRQQLENTRKTYGYRCHKNDAERTRQLFDPSRTKVVFGADGGGGI